ncbi:acyl carrier protein [Bradyrhizobium sp. 21]|nr:acyl carrier protein [Bradyrhizobium sp. 21]
MQHSLLDLQTLLVRLWEEELPIRSVHLDHNFFELGGTSIGAMRVVARLKGDFGYRISPMAVYENGTPRLMAEHLLQISAQ